MRKMNFSFAVMIVILLIGCGGGGGGSKPSITAISSSTVAVASSSSLSLSSSSSSSSSLSPLAFGDTSYENKVADTDVSVHDLFDSYLSLARQNGILAPTESVGNHGYAVADFQQVGKYIVIANTSFMGQHDSDGKPIHGSIIAVDVTGKNITDSLIEGGRTGCIHPRKPIIADFNNDHRPDVVFACHGDDLPTTPGESSLIVLSNPNGKYTVSKIAGTEDGFTHSGSAADIDADGNIDLVLADTKFNNHTQSLRVLLGAGDGTFIGDVLRIDLEKVAGRNPIHANYYAAELIEIESVIYLLAGGNEQCGVISTNDMVPTIMVPFKSGYADYENVVKLPCSIVVDNSVVLDFASDGASLYVLHAIDVYAGMSIQKIDLKSYISSEIYTSKGKLSEKNPASWIPFFSVVKGKLDSGNSDDDSFFE
jgi:hypothetical protein